MTCIVAGQCEGNHYLRFRHTCTRRLIGEMRVINAAIKAPVESPAVSLDLISGHPDQSFAGFTRSNVATRRASEVRGWLLHAFDVIVKSNRDYMRPPLALISFTCHEVDLHGCTRISRVSSRYSRTSAEIDFVTSETN